MSSDPQAASRSWGARFARFYAMQFMALATVAMGLIVVVMTLQVFYRYVLNDSLIWAEEVCRYLLILMTFLLIGPAFERGEMATVQFFMRLLPARAARLLLIPIYLVLIAFLVAVAYFGHQFAALNSRFSMPAIDFILGSLLRRPVSGAVSMYWIYMLIPAGCLILGAHLAVAIARIVRATS